MGLIPSIKVWGTETLTDADLNGALAAIRNAVNATSLFTDVARTVTGIITFDTPPVFTNAQAFAGNVTVATGLTVTTGGLTVTAGGVTVTAGGVTVTAGGLTVVAGASTFAAAVTVTGTVTATTFAGSGASLTGLPAAELTGTLPAVSGVNLTALNASNIASGTINAARLPTIALANAALSLAVSSNVVDIDPSSTALIVEASASSWQTGSAPGGSGAARYINVTLNGTAYRILCATVA